VSAAHRPYTTSAAPGPKWDEGPTRIERAPARGFPLVPCGAARRRVMVPGVCVNFDDGAGDTRFSHRMRYIGPQFGGGWRF